MLGIKRRAAEADQTVADDLGAWTTQTFAYRKRRSNLEAFGLLLVVVITIVAGALIGLSAVLPDPRKSGSTTLKPTLGAASQGVAETSVSVVKSSYSARKEADDLRSQLAQAAEQLKSSQRRVSQLEGQLKQTPSSTDLDNARKQADGLQSQLAQATEQLKSSQGRVSQLEAQLKQTPSSTDDNARKQADDLQSQLAQAAEQLRSSQGRVSQLEAQLKQTPKAKRQKVVVGHDGRGAPRSR